MAVELLTGTLPDDDAIDSGAGIYVNELDALDHSWPSGGSTYRPIPPHIARAWSEAW